MDTASTSDAVNFITYVQTLKRKIKQFEKNVDVSTRYEQKQLVQFSVYFFFFFLKSPNHLFCPIIFSCSAMDSVCWRSKDSSSLHLGFTLTTLKVNGVPSVTSWSEKILLFSSRWPTSRWKLSKKTKLWRTVPRTYSMTGRRPNQLP